MCFDLSIILHHKFIFNPILKHIDFKTTNVFFKTIRQNNIKNKKFYEHQTERKKIFAA